MSKKDFTQVNTNAVYSAIAEATQSGQKERKTYTQEEAAAYISEGKTKGRKGVKMPRINLAVTPECFDYVRIMSKATGQTYQEFMQEVIKQHMESHAETYKKAQELLQELKA